MQQASFSFASKLQKSSVKYLALGCNFIDVGIGAGYNNR